MRRRQFLKVAAGVGAGLLLGSRRRTSRSERIWGKEMGSDSDLEDAKFVALRMADVLREWPPIKGEPELGLMTQAIVAAYVDNGIVPAGRYPTSDTFEEYDGPARIWKYGESDCRGMISLNGVLFGEASEFGGMRYRSFQYLLTRVHEIGHIQQGALCIEAGMDREGMEASVQVGMTEVVASLAHRSGVMLGSFVKGMRDMGFYSAWYGFMGKKGNWQEKVDDLALKVLDPSEMAWNGRVVSEVVPELGESKFMVGLETYYYSPLMAIVQATLSDSMKVRHLGFPLTTDQQEIPESGEHYYITGRSRLAATVVADDTARVLENMEWLALKHKMGMI